MSAVPTFKLGEIAQVVSGGTPSRANPGYWGGDIPWVKTSEIRNNRIDVSDIEERITQDGLKNSSARLVPAGTVLMAMYGQGGTRGRVAILKCDAAISQNSGAFVLEDSVDREYIYHVLRMHYERLRAQSNSGGLNFLSTDALLSLRVLLPPLEDQQRIAQTLGTWDEAIEKTERLIAAKRAAHSDLLDRLLACADGRVVAVRELASEVSVRNAEGCVELVLSVTNRGGFELPADRFSRRIASEDLRGYKLVCRGQFAYNPSRLNVGSIDRLDKWDIAALSPMYVVFELDDTVGDSDFFLHWLDSSWARGHISRSTQGSVRESVGFPDFGAIRMRLPRLTEQRRIAGILNLAQREIDLLMQLKQQYELQRQGLEQRLLTPPDTSRAAS